MKIVGLNRRTDNSGGVTITAEIITDEGQVNLVFPPAHPMSGEANKSVSDLMEGHISQEHLAARLLQLNDIPEIVEESFNRVSDILDGRMRVANGRVLVDGDAIDEVLEQHILRLIENGKDADWGALANFVGNLYQNVNEHVRLQLFSWLRHESHSGGFTLTPDGCFVGYKGCAGTAEEPTSIQGGVAFVNGERFAGRIPNKVGSLVEMDRKDVQNNPAVGCAPGLHVGTYNYASTWNSLITVVVLVKVNPRDVVSVPTECDAQKIRTQRYEVVEIIEERQSNLTYGLEEDYSEDFGVGDSISFTYEPVPGAVSHRVITVDSVDEDFVRGENLKGEYRAFRRDRMSDVVLVDTSDDLDYEEEDEESEDSDTWQIQPRSLPISEGSRIRFAGVDGLVHELLVVGITYNGFVGEDEDGYGHYVHLKDIAQIHFVHPAEEPQGDAAADNADSDSSRPKADIEDELKPFIPMVIVLSDGTRLEGTAAPALDGKINVATLTGEFKTVTVADIVSVEPLPLDTFIEGAARTIAKKFFGN